MKPTSCISYIYGDKNHSIISNNKKSKQLTKVTYIL